MKFQNIPTIMKTHSVEAVPLTPVRIPAGNGLELEADLQVPAHARGLVVFAHGSGSSRHSPRNRFVAAHLQRHGLATLLADLLTEIEDITCAPRFDIALLEHRLLAISRWASWDPRTHGLAIGYFGSSTGAAAALRAAAQLHPEVVPQCVAALVSRGGRVDLAEDAARVVRVPVLLIVGEYDYGVREANERVHGLLRGPKKLVVVPEATHLFEEPGALERVAEVAAEWFVRHLGAEREHPGGDAHAPRRAA